MVNVCLTVTVKVRIDENYRCLMVRLDQNCRCLMFINFQSVETKNQEFGCLICRMGTIPDRCAYWGCAPMIQASTMPAAQWVNHSCGFRTACIQMQVTIRPKMWFPFIIPCLIRYDGPTDFGKVMIYNDATSYHKMSGQCLLIPCLIHYVLCRT